MKLLKYSNERYAGMRDQDVNFKPGMNVIIGDNETGKSTMISGIYDTLLRASKTDKRKDKEFIARSFPAGGGSSIDGKVKFDIDGQEYTVKKEWEKSGKDYRSTFITESTGDKDKKDQKKTGVKTGDTFAMKAAVAGMLISLGMACVIIIRKRRK